MTLKVTTQDIKRQTISCLTVPRVVLNFFDSQSNILLVFQK
jgi:hypothetical protein